MTSSRTWKMSLVLESPGICSAMMQTQTLQYARPHTSFVLKQFLCYSFTTCDSDEHILQYECCYHTIYMVSNCCLSLYLNIAGLPQGPGKCFWVHGKVLEFFVTKRVGTLFMDDVIFAGSSWPDPCSPTAQR